MQVDAWKGRMDCEDHTKSLESPPPSRSELIRTALLEMGIGFVAVWVVILWRGGWRRFKAQAFTLDWLMEIMTIGLMIMAGATLLAIRDYRAGEKKLAAWEHRQMWGRDPD